MEKTIQIGNKTIGTSHPCYTIAETGINHNGELERAYAMISAAKEAGADAVKFQTFKADEFIADPNLIYTYRSDGKEVTESMLAMFRRYEFSRDEWSLIKKRCDDENIVFLSTPQNISDLDLLLEIGIPAIKVGSDDFTNLPLLKRFSQTRLPIITSCGMAELSEIHSALEAINALDRYPAVLLLCNSQYPTPAEDLNLLRLNTLADIFPDLLLGFSDHTQGSLASSLAVALGAVVFEKHFTLDQTLPGPDHWFSENPEGLKEWVSAIRKASIVMGSPDVKPAKAELNMRSLARRSIVALSDIKPGEILSPENIGLRRPGNGLSPALFDKTLGSRAVRQVTKGSLLQLGDFE